MKTEEAKKLLYAMSEIEDSYVEETLSFEEKKQAHRKRLAFPVSKKVLLTLVACLVMGLSFYQSVKVDSTLEGNPYKEVPSLEAAYFITGFTLKAPEVKPPCTDVIYSVYTNSVIEATYITEDSFESMYYIRKSKRDEAISGDYNDYANTRTEKVDGRVITLKGNDGKWSLATWSENGYYYAIGAVKYPMTKEDILALTKEVS